jgi:hypothetical protein
MHCQLLGGFGCWEVLLDAGVHEGLDELALKRRKATSRGATEISVAADMMDQLTPDSGAPKIPSPTVNGRVSTELVTMRGQRKLFQWWLMDTRP